MNHRSEREKMLAGELYQGDAPELMETRQQAKEVCFQFNQTSPLQTEKRQALLRGLFGSMGKNPWVESPFHVDYGSYLTVGDNFYANHGCTILDGNPVRIGNSCFLAPHVCITAAKHPLEPNLRASGLETASGITIGNNVWIGANATICPGVTLGDNVVVGAGAVVTKDFPDNVVIAGVPAKILPRKDKDTSISNNT